MTIRNPSFCVGPFIGKGINYSSEEEEEEEVATNSSYHMD